MRFTRVRFDPARYTETLSVLEDLTALGQRFPGFQGTYGGVDQTSGAGAPTTAASEFEVLALGPVKAVEQIDHDVGSGVQDHRGGGRTWSSRELPAAWSRGHRDWLGRLDEREGATQTK